MLYYPLFSELKSATISENGLSDHSVDNSQTKLAFFCIGSLASKLGSYHQVPVVMTRPCGFLCV